MTTAVPTERRETYLAPYLDDLRRFVRTRAAVRPTAVSVGSRSLPVEAWEWEALVEWCGAARSGWQSLLANGLALEARCLTDVEKSANEPGGAGSRGSDLQFDAIVGFKLMIGLQRAVERMVIHGRMDQAKKLTYFRHRVNESVAAVGARIGEEALREAEALGMASGEYGDHEDDDPGPSPRDDGGIQALLDLEEKLEKIATQPGVPVSAPAAPSQGETPRPWSRPLLLAGVLTALTIVWFFFVAWPAASHKPARAFSRADFATIDAIRDVVARPPSLFVVVDEAKWRALNDAERRAAVDTVAGAIEPAGYTGVRFGAPTGATVAQWLKATGAHLNDLSKEPS